MRFYSMIFLLIYASASVAADKKGNYAIWGAGNSPCHGYNLARAANEDNKFRDYIMGYFTAYNHEAADTYSISRDMNLNEILNWVDEQCELKPITSIEEVLTNFIIENYENRMKSAPGSRVGR
ncbi:MAG: hypothetical protein A3I13_03075 [Gammaproteobacteria bacterium RIFCSPLOWO2_02_FULL_47_50]|nr:MAG: hypothetical protein A2W69_02130 [Gammaproteobacteria bacterium RIFCSPLOWO2_02_47_7]OGT66533.1 MAG: hypothetical protein A2993_04575 [Gammaproteobacteria bacterium RIFCSPLOWO2_01_FULL_47_190]OGT77033.1 MAG: hypothetical protein A2W76_06295 [Gammaproteobacteria bacterium RIFCSPLOWO2_12_47_11]OGT78680.1 MAG: hypothetical protein A3I13_03075 [Gammaproteobacteria bacterium RIFCSPLOWO2_02_FULL_47_50]OGT87925.1 MAG: hypothetical protein A3G42_01925 [Gammaproteobacteria bacterium RIFCSPLOWO2_1